MPSNIINTSLHGVCTCDILVEGAAIDPAIQVRAISVIHEVNKIPLAKLIFIDGSVADATFPVSNENLFVPGNKIKINLGYDSDNVQVFQGVITRHAIKIGAGGESELIVDCRDEAVKMTIGRQSKYYQNVKDSDLFDQLVSAHGLSRSGDATSLTHQEMVQHHMTDWDFLLLRAEANGMLVLVNDGLVRVVTPDGNAKPVLTISYGESIMEFEAEMDSRQQLKAVRTRAWDYKSQALFESEAGSPGFKEAGNISGNTLSNTVSPEKYDLHHGGHRLEQELKDWAEARMLRSRLAKIRGRARVFGSAVIKPGDMLEIQGVGDRFNGNTYTTAVRHDLSMGSWDMHLQFGLDSEPFSQRNPDIYDTPGAGLIGSIQGLQIGKVVQLESDPDGEDRILVRIPMIDNSAGGVWTRVASLDAGSDRGAFFMPEIDDEVIVGFINDDPRDAVMLGMLHSSAKVAPLKASDLNHEKGFTTRSKMHVSFNDDTKTIKIDTPAGNSITLDEQNKKIEIKDQNNNVVTMDTAGIKLESPKEVTVKAGTNMTLEAGSQLAIKAVSISLKASADVNVQGNASAGLSSSGVTEVKGSLVKVN